MADPKPPAQPPIAIRITRPYETEEEFLAREMDTLTRTSILLLGAQSRPQGVVLRFELSLASGAPLVRGEGRVTAFKELAFEGMSGLTLRFTRLDSKSKALIDRAAALRDARGRPSTLPGSSSVSPPPPAVAPLPTMATGEFPVAAPSPFPEIPPAAPAPAPSVPKPAPPSMRMPSKPPPRPSTRAMPAARPAPPPPPIEPLTLDLDATRAEVPMARARSERPPPPSARPPPPPSGRAAPSRPPPLPPMPAAPPAPYDLESTRAEAPRSKSQRPPTPFAAGPTDDRSSTLERLRARAKSLSPETVHTILDEGRTRRAP